MGFRRERDITRQEGGRVGALPREEEEAVPRREEPALSRREEAAVPRREEAALPRREEAPPARRAEPPGAAAVDSPRRRVPVGWRLRRGGAAAVGTAGAGILRLARLVMLAAVLIALLIGLAIVLRVTGANAANSIVSNVHDAANFFAGSANGLYTSHGHAGRELAINWGIAAVLYLIVGALISAFIRRIGVGGLEFDRRHRGRVPPV